MENCTDSPKERNDDFIFAHISRNFLVLNANRISSPLLLTVKNALAKMHRSPSSKCDCEMRPPFYNFYSPIELAAAGLILNLLQLLNRIINPHSTRETVMFIVLLNFSTWRAEKWAPISSSCPLLIWLSSHESVNANVLLSPRVLTKHAKLFTEDGECNSVRKLVMINLGVNSPGSSLHSRQFPTRSSTERNRTSLVFLAIFVTRKKTETKANWYVKTSHFYAVWVEMQNV